MANRDALAIFRQFWPTEGYAGIHPHLPEWSRSRASNFAHRNGIRMNDEHRKAVYIESGRRGGDKSSGKEVPRVDSLESRFLSARW